MRISRISLTIFIGLILSIAALASIGLADTKEDFAFLYGDPDGDEIATWEEYLIGTDPYNSDSDNDGLPDNWEHGNDLDPSDSSDAHEDLDYFPLYNASVGEHEAAYDAIKKDIDVWPSNRQITFSEAVFQEDGPHYDNYEEYYRPYYDQYDNMKLKVMHTLPNHPNTDGDEYLDPDDPEPFNFKNDGTGIGGASISTSEKTNNIKAIEIEDNSNENIIYLEDNSETPEYNFDVNVQQPDSNQQPPTEDKKYFADVDNDGI